MRKLNLGCGPKPLEGYINIDLVKEFNPDIVRNIERGLPFDDNSVDEIFTSHFLEHIDPDLIHFVMYEIWRVCKHGAEVSIIVPIGNGWSNSPEHKCPFNAHSDVFFTKWNYPILTGYNYKLKEKSIFRASVNDLEDSDGYGDELHMVLEVIK